MNWTLWQKILDVLYRFKLWVAGKWATTGPVLLGSARPGVAYWLTEEVSVVQYKLLQFADVLAAFGLPLLEVPADPLDLSRPPVPEGDMPVLYIRVPPSQEAAFLEYDCVDPTHVDEESEVPAGGEARRLLSMMRLNGVITGWCAFQDNGGVGVHVLLSLSQATAWYSLMDWPDKSVLTAPQQKDKQVFL